MRVVISALLAVAVPSCTLVGVGVGSGVTATHNAFTEDRNDWSYSTPMWTGAAIGLLCDIVLLIYMQKQWSKPLT